MLSLSTSWNHNPDLDMNLWLSSVKAVGFEAVELGYTLTARQLEALSGALSSMDMKVSSIHNFCPIPDDGPSDRHASNYYRLSSLDDHERRKAVEWTQKTIDLAVHVKAPVVIIHAGTLELEPDPATEMIRLYKEGKAGSKEFKKLREGLVKVRREKSGPYIEVLKESLKDVTDHAYQKKIKIGLETRYYPFEIPNFEEIGAFLKLFQSRGMGYWHDVGHAEVNERLGLAKHGDFLKKYRDDLIGVHIHGIRQLRDHLAPFDGDLDLKKILPLFPSGIIRVVESRYASPEQIKDAFKQLS